MAVPAVSLVPSLLCGVWYSKGWAGVEPDFVEHVTCRERRHCPVCVRPERGGADVEGLCAPQMISVVYKTPLDDWEHSSLLGKRERTAQMDDRSWKQFSD